MRRERRRRKRRGGAQPSERSAEPSATEAQELLYRLGDAAHLAFDAVAVFCFGIRTAFTATCAVYRHGDDEWSPHFLKLLDDDKRFNVLMVGLKSHPEDTAAFIAHYDMCMETMVKLQYAS